MVKMKRRLQITKVSGKNSLHRWWRVKCPFFTAINYCVVCLAKKMPSLTLKNILLRSIEVKIGRDASIAPDVDIDFLYPELIEIGENAIIGYGATILAHEFLIDEYRTGKVIIGKNALIGAKAIILAGVKIGKGARVGAGSVVCEDVKENSFVAGVPAREIRKG